MYPKDAAPLRVVCYKNQLKMDQEPSHKTQNAETASQKRQRKEFLKKEKKKNPTSKIDKTMSQHEIKKLLYNQRSYQQSKQKTYRVGGKSCTRYPPDRGLTFRICKELQKSNTKEKINK